MDAIYDVNNISIEDRSSNISSENDVAIDSLETLNKIPPLRYQVRREVDMADDQELVAMTAIAKALEPLDEAARGRALSWVAAKYRLAAGTMSRGAPPLASTRDTQVFADFAEIFAAADPKTDKERALVAAYWTQVCQSQANFTSQTLNTGLKDLGHGVGNITRALEELKDEKPALVLQLQKSGTAKQARKTLRLTQEGIKRVLKMISEGEP